MSSEKSIYDFYFETDFVVCESKTRICDYTSSSVQTDEDTNIAELEQLKKEVTKLKNENIRLTHQIKEIANIIAVIAKVSGPEPNIDKIKENLAIIVNREIRMHKPIPFISESLIRHKSKNISL
jgi:hypothetical protein